MNTILLTLGAILILLFLFWLMFCTRYGLIMVLSTFVVPSTWFLITGEMSFTGEPEAMSGYIMGVVMLLVSILLRND